MRLIALSLSALLVCGPAAVAREAAPAPLSDSELAALRGGLMTPLGVDIGFGATVRTYVDGQLALESRLTWTEAGPVAERLDSLGQASAQGPAQGGWTSILPGLTGGQTQVLHDLTDGRIANVIVNTANGRDVRQNTDITLTVPQLADLQSRMAADRIAGALGGALDFALTDRAGR